MAFFNERLDISLENLLVCLLVYFAVFICRDIIED